ncbi:hypothetical protein I7107_000209 [Vibrio parahaemolyticus]|nr:hypothetical protein [Vibrio parahaemolyticus]EGQ8145784.1 hypothetical protein [Vibrio parahaemolyticus]EGQ8196279.1 hypothetical protein [Vibrio parahaemolyticus]
MALCVKPKFATGKLAHSTSQNWYPNQHSEDTMYTNFGMHGFLINSKV